MGTRRSPKRRCRLGLTEYTATSTTTKCTGIRGLAKSTRRILPRITERTGATTSESTSSTASERAKTSGRFWSTKH